MAEVTSVRLHDVAEVTYTEPSGFAWTNQATVLSDEYYSVQDRHRSSMSGDGWRPPLPYHRTIGKYRKANGVCEYIAPSGTTVRVTGPDPWRSYNLNPPGFPAWLSNAALIDALTKLKGQGVNLGQAFAERDQTARLVGDTASRIARAYRATRKGDLRGAARALGASWKKQPRNWLELQYGWKPLLSDVYNSVEELKGLDPSEWLVTVKGTKRLVSRREFDDKFAASVPFRNSEELFQGAFVRLDYHPSNTFQATLTRIGLTNPLALAWELLPYSFVVDWFWPIGDWLNVLDATSGFDFAGGSLSTITRYGVHLKPIHYMVGGAQLKRNSFSEGYTRSVSLNRSVYGASPLPRPPGLKNPASLGHMANGLSLLAEAFGRRR